MPPFHWWRTVFFLIPAIAVYTIVLGTISLASSFFDRSGRFAHKCARAWSWLILKTTGVTRRAQRARSPAARHQLRVRRQPPEHLRHPGAVLDARLRAADPGQGLAGQLSVPRLAPGAHRPRPRRSQEPRRRPVPPGAGADAGGLLALRVPGGHAQPRRLARALPRRHLHDGDRGRPAGGAGRGRRQPLRDAQGPADDVAGPRPRHRPRSDPDGRPPSRGGARLRPPGAGRHRRRARPRPRRPGRRPCRRDARPRPGARPDRRARLPRLRRRHRRRARPSPRRAVRRGRGAAAGRRHGARRGRAADARAVSRHRPRSDQDAAVVRGAAAARAARRHAAAGQHHRRSLQLVLGRDADRLRRLRSRSHRRRRAGAAARRRRRGLRRHPQGPRQRRRPADAGRRRGPVRQPDLGFAAHVGVDRDDARAVRAVRAGVDAGRRRARGRCR